MLSMLILIINKSLQSDRLMINEFSRFSIVICNKLKTQPNPGYNQRDVTLTMAGQRSAPSSSNNLYNNPPSVNGQYVEQNRNWRSEQNCQNNFDHPSNFVPFTNYGVTWPGWQIRQCPNPTLYYGNTPYAGQSLPHGHQQRHRSRTNVDRNAMSGLRFWERMPARKNAAGFVFTVMSYNILAQDLIQHHLNLYKSHNKNTLQWNVRWNNLLAEISHLKPDILCLQEVQNSHLDSNFSELKNLGYSGLFKKRTGGHTDGCAIYYKSDKIKLVEHVTVEYKQPQVSILDRDNVGIIAKFAPSANSGKEFVVATTHLLYNPKRQDVKLAQMQLLLTEIDRIAFTLGGKYLPVILTGDLNVSPDSAVYKFIANGKLQYDNLSARLLQLGGTGPKMGKHFLPKFLRITDRCQHADLLSIRKKNVALSRSEELKSIEIQHSERKNSANKQNNENSSKRQENNKDDGNLFSSGTLKHSLAFKSVYQHNYNGDHEATTYQDQWVTVDYIFYSQVRELILLERYRLPTESELGNVTFPNENLGSDHLSLLAKFEL